MQHTTLEGPPAQDRSAHTSSHTHASFQESHSGQSSLRRSSRQEAMPVRNDSKRSAQSVESPDPDVDDDMDAQGVTDDEAAGGDSRPQKKKKAQRFYCTDFPPCSLSFTRSEHLARHIRKHTGERPFQCHCMRRFSRLDNLRQHAQTVHVNEDIPTDSLAATGTRFQRQIRTDRVRAPTRGKTSSVSGPSAVSRGHSRNISNSSIGSISDMGSPNDDRRRPPTLAMAQMQAPHPHASAGAEVYGPGSQYPQPPQDNGPYYFGHASPNGYGTPNTTFSGDPASPRYSTTLASPVSMAPPSHVPSSSTSSIPTSHHHQHSSQGHTRRLSQPTAFNPTPYYTNSQSYHSPPPSNGPYYIGGNQASPYSNSGSMFASPTNTTLLPDGRHESSAEADWRRRTWHPGTYSNMAPRPATSGLSYYQTPDAPQPVPADQPAAAQQGLRLPGIDSFVSASNAPARPSNKSLDVDESRRPAHEHSGSQQHDVETPSKRDSWGSVNQHFAQLEVQGGTAAPEERSANWRHSAPVRASLGSHHVTPSFTFPPTSNSISEPLSPETPTTPRKKKREAWYNGPLQHTATGSTSSGHRISPEGSASSDGLPTPSTQNMTEYHPAIINSSGFTDADASVAVLSDADAKSQPEMLSPPLHDRHVSNTARLDALVAVATGENHALRGH